MEGILKVGGRLMRPEICIKALKRPLAFGCKTLKTGKPPVAPKSRFVPELRWQRRGNGRKTSQCPPESWGVFFHSRVLGIESNRSSTGMKSTMTETVVVHSGVVKEQVPSST